MPDFHCRARSYLSFRLGIKICRIVTRLLLQVLFSLLSCTYMPAIHPCLPSIIHAIPHSIPSYSIPFQLLNSSFFSSLLFHLQVDLVQNSSLNRNPKTPAQFIHSPSPHFLFPKSCPPNSIFTVFTPSLTFSNPSIQLSKFPDFSSLLSLQQDYYFDFFLSLLSHLSHLSSQNS